MLVIKDMDVNEREVLSNITLRHKLKEQRFYCYSTFHMYMYMYIVSTEVNVLVTCIFGPLPEGVVVVMIIW
jgi:hypothetical protein